MVCPNCAAPLPGVPPICPRCGHPILEDDRTVRLEFQGRALEWLGWLLLTILSAILVVPLAWTVAACCRWFCRNLRFSDGASAQFTGTGPEILGWMILSVILGAIDAAPRALRGPVHIRLIDIQLTNAPVPVQVALDIVTFFLSAWVGWCILRWMVSKIALSTGPQMHFDGRYSGYLGYELLIGLSGLTIIGWAWVTASFYRWMALHTRGEGIAIHFHGKGLEILWRTVVMVLGCILIVTIPAVTMWYVRWLVGSVTITRGATNFDGELA